MNVLALDIGDSRIGVAYGNTNSMVATAVAVVAADDVFNKSKNFQNIMDDYIPEKFIIGYPKSLSGEDNFQAIKVKDLGEKIGEIYNIPVEFIDERLSSQEAKVYLKDQGLSEKEMKGKIDSVAASIFLET